MQTGLVRFDRGELARPQRRDNGHVIFEGRPTRAGVFVYRDAAGGERRELRHPDDVFDAASIDTLKLVPFTVDHPGVGRLDASNTRAHIAGVVGETVRRDGTHVAANVAVMDARALEAIASGTVELSCGYRCDVEPEAGVYEGEAYTHRQRRIAYNHLALVERGRAGHTAALRVDSAGNQIPDTGASKRMKTIEIKGTKHEIADAVAEHIDALDAAAKTAEAKRAAASDALAQVTKERDTARADVAKAEAEVKTRVDAAVEGSVAELVALREKARTICGADVKLDGLGAAAVRALIVAKRFPDVKLDGKPAAYVEALCDAATRTDAAAAMAQANAGTPPAGAGEARADAGAIRNDNDFRAFVASQRKVGADAFQKALTPAA